VLPVVLCVLDGWGFGGLPSPLYEKETPYIHSLFEHYKWCLLEASEKAVGLPLGQMGNSEVGHLTLGAGRIILQDLARIHKTFENDSFKHQPLFQNFIQKTRQGTNHCHILGLLSKGGVHGHSDHLIHMAHALASEGIYVHIHGFTDGRDTSPQDSLNTLQDFLNQIDHPLISLETLMGRYYAMDRDNRLERTEKAYNAIVLGEAEETDNFIDSIKASYEKGIFDEFILPLKKSSYKGIQDQDSLVVTHFRADRIRQILRAFYFENSNRKQKPDFSASLAFVSYADDLTPYMDVLFPHQHIHKTLGEIISDEGLSQFRIAETEKYAHVTYFFNGGREDPFLNENRVLIPSPKVGYYDEKPEMSAEEMTNTLLSRLNEHKDSFILINYANPDMIGHTGNFEATKKAMAFMDVCIKRLASWVLSHNALLILTSDHGNVEEMVNLQTGLPQTAHTLSKVPCLFIASQNIQLKASEGELADIAPTVLYSMGINVPQEMTGKVLVEL
jgi:2,3-bisphosphoglycerate-independent phosphoglycerate mutase